MKDITLKKIWVLILNIYCLKYVWNSKYEVIYQSCGIVLMRNRDFSKRKNIFCSFLLIKLFTVVIIAVVRSGRYKRFRMCSGLEFYSKTKDSHRRLFAVATDESTFHLLLSLEQTQCLCCGALTLACRHVFSSSCCSGSFHV